MTAKLALLLLALVPTSMSACTLAWLLTSDPEGLPCAIVDGGAGECLANYACVRGVCVKEGVKQQGDPCEETAECLAGLACAVGDAYAACDGELADDVNCARIDAAEREKRCRAPCDPGDAQSCPAGDRCIILFDGEVEGVCQKGVCFSDSDCAAQQAICSGVLVQGGAGFCFETCDPLSCSQGACTGCDGLDGLNDGLNCIVDPGFAPQNGRFRCEAAGEVADFQSCAQGLCGLGSTCVADVLGNASCAPYCRAPSGNPACDAQSACVAAFGNIGICQR